MKFFKDLNNKVYAFDVDGSQDSYITSDLIAITSQEKKELLSILQTPNQEQQAELDKYTLDTAIDALTVTVDTLVFKANDKSISRMSAAIQDSLYTGQTEAFWKLADGSFQLITLDQLKQAQSLAIRSIGLLLIA